MAKALDVYDLGINCARQQAIMLFLSSMLIATTEFHISFIKYRGSFKFVSSKTGAEGRGRGT